MADFFRTFFFAFLRKKCICLSTFVVVQFMHYKQVMRKSNNIVVVCRTLLLFAIWLYGLLLTAGRDAAFATGDLDIAS